MSQSAIIKICQGQPELAVRIVQPGCSGGQLINYENIRMLIQAPSCNRLLKSPMIFTGCWPGFKTPWRDSPAPHELGVIVYPAFNTNDAGETVFRFDDKLFKLPPGRYWGLVEFTDGTSIAKLDLDLCNTPFLLDSATLTSTNCTDEDSCL